MWKNASLPKFWENVAKYDSLRVVNRRLSQLFQTKPRACDKNEVCLSIISEAKLKWTRKT